MKHVFYPIEQCSMFKVKKKTWTNTLFTNTEHKCPLLSTTHKKGSRGCNI